MVKRKIKEKRRDGRNDHDDVDGHGHAMEVLRNSRTLYIQNVNSIATVRMKLMSLRNLMWVLRTMQLQHPRKFIYFATKRNNSYPAIHG